MSFRTSLRRSLPYAVTIIGGFLLAYLIVAFLIFPSGVIPGDAKVPNVGGLLYDDAAKRLSVTRAELDAQLAALGKAAGPPWGKDQKEAAAAALVVLKQAGGD